MNWSFGRTTLPRRALPNAYWVSQIGIIGAALIARVAAGTRSGVRLNPKTKNLTQKESEKP